MKSPLRYMGGKSRLVSTLAPVIEATPHTCYCEPFCGAAWMLFGIDPACSKAEVINDADGELVSFWRVVQHHLLPFIDLYRHAVVSRQIYEWENIKRPETLTDLQRAARYYYLQRLGFGGKTAGRVFGTTTEARPALDIDGISARLMEVHQRLSSVVIEHLDGIECIRRYDRPHTLFFIDPPYCDVTGYAAPFQKERYTELAETLASIKGRFMLTLNPHPHILQTFKPFRMYATKTQYTVGLGLHRTVDEVMFTNMEVTL